MIAKLRALSAKQVSLAVAAAAIFGVTGAVGVSHAAPAWKPSQEECDAKIAAGVYKNRGECVSEAAHNKSGYGG